MAPISTRPLPHHFAGEWGPNQIADLEEDLTVLAEDLASVALYTTVLNSRVDGIAGVRQPAVLPPGGFSWGGGDDGQDGFPGVAGIAGVAGTRGVDGVPGFPGDQGEDGEAWPGPMGPTGAGGAPASSAPTTTGTQTALAIPTGTGPLTLYLNNASLLTVQGIAAGIADQLLFVFSKGAGQVDFAHLHASGTALGQLKLFATVGLTSLAAGSGVAVFQYDLTVTQWRLVAHEQGAWIRPAFNAGDFVGVAPLTWTVDAGDVSEYAYRLSGRTLTVAWYLAATTLSGTSGFALDIAIPAGLTTLGTMFGAPLPYYYAESGAPTLFFCAPRTTTIRLLHAASAWALGVNTMTTIGEISIEVI
jgi:hypothetical protein